MECFIFFFYLLLELAISISAVFFDTKKTS